MKKTWSSLLDGLQRAGKYLQSKSASLSNETASSAGGARGGGRLNPLQSVGTKLFAIFFFCILFFVLVVGLISYAKSKDVIQTKVADASEQTIIQAGQKLDLIYSTYEDLSLQIMLNEDLRKLMVELSAVDRGSYNYLESTRFITEKLNVYAFANKNIKAVHLLTEKGEPITSSTGNPGGGSRGDKDWFKKIVDGNGQVVWLATSEKGFLDENVVTSTATPAFAVGRVLKSLNTSQITGVVLIEIKLDVMSEQMKQISMGDGGSTVIVSEDDNYVYNEDKLLLAKPSNLDIEKGALDQQFGQLKTRDDQYQLVYYKSGKSGWNLIGSIPVKELVKDASVIFDITVAMAFGAALIAVVIGFMLARMIGRPLIQLRNLMKEG
ncbi:Cache domain-containing protein, partial [Paenibacillus sp. UNCCL117]|uniref:cache domain-containing protein n=2 Tax=unclassified Paenibacillus TaxID=185978 RepID=UPI0009086D67